MAASYFGSCRPARDGGGGGMSPSLGGGCLKVLVGRVLVASHLHAGHVLLLGRGRCVHLDEAVLGAAYL